MEPTNDHERVIARAVDEKILEDPGDSHHSIIRDVAMSLDFIMSPSESQFLVRYVLWRLDHPNRPMVGTTSDDPSFTLQCPNCGLSTQYHLMKLNLQLKDSQHVDFFCVGCRYTEMLTADKFPGLLEALDKIRRFNLADPKSPPVRHP
jgi:hypothetical protein